MMRSVEMANRHKYTSASFAFVLLLLPLVLWGSSRPVPAATSLSVGFVGLTNGPARQMKPTRIEVCQGATGLCAMFSVRDVSSNRWIWFKTASIEQKTPTGWQTFLPNRASWSGINGGYWSPGYGCLYAVGWPPGLPTNATWRLRVSYGPEPSRLGMIVNRKLGREIFHGGPEEAAIWDSGRARNGHGCRESAMLVFCNLFDGAVFRRKIFG
jgi:hypothetical protein